jgi:hypothetical protein
MTGERTRTSMGRAVVTVCAACAITCGCAFALMTVFAAPLEHARVEPSVVGLLPILLTDRLHRLLTDRDRHYHGPTTASGRSPLWGTEAVLVAALLWFVIVVAQAVAGLNVDSGFNFLIAYDVPVVVSVLVISVWASWRLERAAVLAGLLCCGCSLILMALLDGPLRQVHLQPLVEGFGLVPILLLDAMYESLRSADQRRDGQLMPRAPASRQRRWGITASVLALLLYVGYTVSGIASIIVFESGKVDSSASESATRFLIILILALLMGVWAAQRYGVHDLQIAWTACIISTVVPLVLAVSTGTDLLYMVTGQSAWCVSTMGASWVGCVLGRRLKAQPPVNPMVPGQVVAPETPDRRTPG